MNRAQKTACIFVALLFFGLTFHELSHLYRYGYLVPLGRHYPTDRESYTDTDYLVAFSLPSVR